MEAAPHSQLLRVLLADGEEKTLDTVASAVTRLGHAVIARETTIGSVVAATERDLPDVAIVVVGENSSNALEQIGAIVREAVCPVIAVLEAEDPAFIRAAAQRGVFAYITDGNLTEAELESAIEVVLHRFAEYHDLEGAFGRRAVIERAKGILMERHQVDDSTAFDMLREQSRSSSRKLIVVAQALLDAHALLPDTTRSSRDSDRTRGR